MKFLLVLLMVGPAFAEYDGLINLGERLFSDPRFSQEFATEATHVNDASVAGISCLSCHKVDSEFDPTTGLGMRTYSDFVAKTPVPLRLEDKIDHTLRNTPALVGIGSPFSTTRFSHWDGEFADHSETVLGNFAGRNMGWLRSEKNKALDQIIAVISGDDGSLELSQEFGGSYDRVFLGVDPSLGDDFRLIESDRLDIKTASKQEVIDLVIKSVTAYLNDLSFERDENNQYIGSPYDQFLLANGFKSAPSPGQTVNQYMVELRSGLAKLNEPKFIAKKYFPTHGREFGFEEQEWAGLKVFFNLPKPDGSLNQGMCLVCHKPPTFSDGLFHNVGTTQLEYERVHGQGSFKQLQIPELDQRGETFMAASSTIEDPKAVDLGVWNFFARNDKPELTQYIRKTHCRDLNNCPNQALLPFMVAKFKTPGLRNLNHSAPYFHNGSSPHLYHLLHEYKRASELMRAGELRNGDPRLRPMKLFHHEIHSLVPFLESLNENYE